MKESLDPNITRVEVLRRIINSKEGLTLTHLSKLMKLPAPQVKYHLPPLEESGLIFKCGNTYVAQAIFADSQFIDLVEKNLGEIFERAASPKEYFFEHTDQQSKEQIVKNCARAAVFLKAMLF